MSGFMSAEELNQKVNLDRLKSNKGLLLKSSKKHFPEVSAGELQRAIRIVKEHIDSITYCTPSTKTKKGLGVLHLKFGIDDVWVSDNGNLIFQIDPESRLEHGQIDRYGNEIK